MLAAVAGLCACAARSEAQSNLQLWSTFAAVKPAGDRLSYTFDLEPKVLLAQAEDDSGWASVDFTGGVDYTVNRFLDVVGEVATGFTIQTADVNSFELSPRGGVRLHLTPRDMQRRPLKPLGVRGRVVLRNLARFEQRTLLYTGGVPTDAVARFRNRLELLLPLNRQRASDDGARYLLTDWEWFIPLDDPAERFANRQRIRAGFGYQRNARWRFETLYIWTRSRDTTEQGFSTSDNIINVRVRRAI
ncbi:MAG TPA: DUF2490 domain-containing protein [Vicinamibacterales bacterium]|nr:DUF2490 domain-containing protein [Vicinamibacterales bacterium]